MSHSENFFLSPFLPDHILHNKNLEGIAKLSPNGFVSLKNTEDVKPINLLIDKYKYENERTKHRTKENRTIKIKN